MRAASRRATGTASRAWSARRHRVHHRDHRRLLEFVEVCGPGDDGDVHLGSARRHVRHDVVGDGVSLRPGPAGTDTGGQICGCEGERRCLEGEVPDQK